MGKYEVTNGEYVKFLNAQTVIDPNWILIDSADPGTTPDFSAYVGLYGDISNPSGIEVKKSPEDYTNRPVVYVTWYGAVAYCNWLSEEYGYTVGTGEGYRLPTEAEWEYVCRGGTTTAYYWGDTMNGDYCWFRDNSGTGYGGPGYENHHNVGLKLPNEFELYDMSGNVYEWCSDWYGFTYYQYCVDNSIVDNPPGSETGSDRVLRGGGWSGSADYCRFSGRDYGVPGYRGSGVGFRLVRSN